MITICISAMNDCICVTRAATITPNAVIVKASSELDRRTPSTISGDA